MNPAHSLSYQPGAEARPSSVRQNTVKARLTANRRRRVVENDDYAAFTRRVLASYARRIALGDIDALEAMTGLADDIDTAIAHAVTGLRTRGYSWTDIGNRLGVTRQAAQQRWGNGSTR